MNKNLFIKAEEIAKELEVSKPYAYKLIRKLNEELKTKALLQFLEKLTDNFLKKKFMGLGRRKVMSAYKDKKTGKWFVFFYYRDWQGKNKGKTKRGFQTKREALEWEREFKQKQETNLDMTFENFVEVYSKDMKARLKLNTWLTKENIIQTKLVPAFGNKKMNEIRPADVIAWQNKMLAYKDEKGNAYSETYLKTVHNQLSAIFNHAVRYYELKSNPASKAGNMGKAQTKEIEFWTKEEYLKFSEAIMDKPLSFYAFEMLYWCGIRLGELLALTPTDFDFEKGVVTINKSYQRIQGEDVVTKPKTVKSNRTIQMPDFLVEEMQDYLKLLYGCKSTDRIFPITKSYLHHEMDRGSKAAGVKRIKLHSLRHSAISLLIDLGFSAVAIADRVGHESIDITYQYAHLFPTKQIEMAQKLNVERCEELGEKFGQARQMAK